MGTERPRSPVVAALLSGLIPGLGQFYCREWRMGVAFLAAFLGADYATGASAGLLEFALHRTLPANMAGVLTGSVLMAGIAAWSVFDAVRTARRSTS
ncbi:hypothetical protein K2X89_06770 [Myxococcota bacterium]|nr:hypothetical protein [Myxococcota bacterium]